MLIPLLLMGGIIGRLFREFAVTLAMTIFVSAFVSLTLTPMMASRFLKARTDEEQHGRLYQLSERGFDAMLRTATSAASTSCCARASLRCCVFFATVALSGYLFVIIPKGFFPQQDTGLISGITEARTGHLVRAT